MPPKKELLVVTTRHGRRTWRLPRNTENFKEFQANFYVHLDSYTHKKTV